MTADGAREPRWLTRRRMLAAGVVGLTGSLAAARDVASGPGLSAATGGTALGGTALGGTAARRPFLGLVDAGGLGGAGIVARGFDTTVLRLGWDRAQPSDGTSLDAGYLRSAVATYRSYRSAGLSVTLDPGMQYAPGWVLALPGAGFVNQYGEVFAAPTESGDNAANAVRNPPVQRAQARYLGLLSAAFGRSAFGAVRAGGLLSGELRYPKGTADHPNNSWWAFGAPAQAVSPVPGYRPGISVRDPAKDAAFLTEYLRALVDYQDVLAGATLAAFSADLELLYPSFGIRPGDVAAALETGLDGTSVRSSEIVQGVTFAGLVARAPVYAPHVATGRRVIAYTTWLDGPQQNSSLQGMSPVAYLARLCAPSRTPVAGENTAHSNGLAQALATCRARAVAHGLVGWMQLDLTGG